MGYRLNIVDVRYTEPPIPAYYGTKLYGYEGYKDASSFRYLIEKGKIDPDYDGFDGYALCLIMLTPEEFAEWARLYETDLGIKWGIMTGGDLVEQMIHDDNYKILFWD